MDEHYWLLNWMKKNEISTVENLNDKLHSSNVFGDLECEAADALDQGPVPYSQTNLPVVGGRGLDLSDELIGGGFEELKREADRLFGTAWHFFDEVIVEGFSPYRFLRMCEDERYDIAKTRIVDHVKLILYLRKIGAIEHVTFRAKPSPCLEHGGDEALLQHAGLSQILHDNERIIKDLVKRGSLDYDDHGDHVHYQYRHPLVGDSNGVLLLSESDNSWLSDQDEAEVMKRVVTDVFGLHARHVAADAAAARDIGAPLAVLHPLHEKLWPAKDANYLLEHEFGSLAVEVGVPILNGIPIADLIRIRRDETECFERFRSALRAAIGEQLSQVRSGRSMRDASARVIDEFIVPSLSDIDQRLSVARRILMRKSSANISIGSMTMAAGLLSTIPILYPAGIALGLGAIGVHYAKFLDDKSQVELSDLYFLWKLQKRRVSIAGT